MIGEISSSSFRFVEEKGFTLAEMLVALSILGLLIATSAVSLGTLAPQFNLDNATRKVAMTLNQARVHAVTRGHTIVVAFGTNDFRIADGDETLATETFPPHIMVSADGAATFTPLGTVTAPVTVTVGNGESSRGVSVGLIGEVQIQ